MTVVVGVVTANDEFASRVTGTICEALPSSWRQSGLSWPRAEFADTRVLTRIIDQGRRLLEKHADAGPLLVVAGSSPTELIERLVRVARADEKAVLCQLFIEFTTDDLRELGPNGLGNSFREIVEMAEQRHLLTLPTPYFAHAFLPSLPAVGEFQCQPSDVIPHLPFDDDWVLDATILCAVFDLLDAYWFDRRTRRQASNAPLKLTFSTEVVEFLRQRHGNAWQLYYYTGSAISSTINAFEHLAREQDVPCIRGPNEHSLAAGAFAAWLVHRRPSVLLLTSGMVDELRGTLANLIAVRARSLVVIPENQEEQWFAFQGTITVDGDSRAVLASRGVPYVHIRNREELPGKLAEAFAAFDRGEGPVFLLVHQTVLDSGAPLVEPIPEPPESNGTPRVVSGDAFAQAMRILNADPCDVMFHCGRLDGDDAARVRRIAAAAGLALTDSFIHPGTIPSHINGKRVPNYIGTLGMYSISPRVYEFLHSADGSVRPSDDVCVFELASRVAQGSTPFNQTLIKNKLRVAQVTREEAHIAPFTALPLVGELSEFLERVEEALDVDSEILKRRQARLDSLQSVPWDLASQVPSAPMTANYFFSRLATTLENLIVERHYNYTGLFEVGRCGISAVYHLPRTQPGVCGWYGRALMGDATMSSITLSAIGDDDILVVQGDGARQMVADPVPSILENAQAQPHRQHPTTTFLNCVNGSLSVIQSYQQRVARRCGGRQMQLYSPLPQDGEMRVGSLSVYHHTMHEYDEETIAAALLERNRINVVSVILTHNNEADGLGLAAVPGWQRPGAQHGASWA